MKKIKVLSLIIGIFLPLISFAQINGSIEVPFVDLKINGSDGPITLPYGSLQSVFPGRLPALLQVVARQVPASG